MKLDNGLEATLKDNHVIFDDGCKSFSIPCPVSDEGVRISYEHAWYNDPNKERRKHLFFVNMDLLALPCSRVGFKISCPVCKKNYIITKEDYQKIIASSQQSS